MILLTYVVSFSFAQVQSNRDFFAVISMMVSRAPPRCLFPFFPLAAVSAGLPVSGVRGLGHAGPVVRQR